MSGVSCSFATAYCSLYVVANPARAETLLAVCAPALKNEQASPCLMWPPNRREGCKRNLKRLGRTKR